MIETLIIILIHSHLKKNIINLYLKYVRKNPAKPIEKKSLIFFDFFAM